jgi:hypothetical protein
LKPLKSEQVEIWICEQFENSKTWTSLQIQNRQNFKTEQINIFEQIWKIKKSEQIWKFEILSKFENLNTLRNSKNWKKSKSWKFQICIFLETEQF